MAKVMPGDCRLANIQFPILGSNRHLEVVPVSLVAVLEEAGIVRSSSQEIQVPSGVGPPAQLRMVPLRLA